MYAATAQVDHRHEGAGVVEPVGPAGKGSFKNKRSHLRPWTDGVIPLTVELGSLDDNAVHLFVRHLQL